MRDPIYILAHDGEYVDHEWDEKSAKGALSVGDHFYDSPVNELWEGVLERSDSFTDIISRDGSFGGTVTEAYSIESVELIARLVDGQVVELTLTDK